MNLFEIFVCLANIAFGLAIMFYYLKNRRNIHINKTLTMVLIIIAIIPIILGIINIMTKKIVNVCSIVFGIYFLIYSFYDGKRHPYSFPTTAWSSYISGISLAIAMIFYGILASLR